MTCEPGLRTAGKTTAQVKFVGPPPWLCGRSERHVLSLEPRMSETLPSAASVKSPHHA